MQRGRRARLRKWVHHAKGTAREEQGWAGGRETETKWVGNAGNTRGVLALFSL